MTASNASRLYTAEILSLAVELADFPLDSGIGEVTEARSRSCGSVVCLGLKVGTDNRISDLGLKVTACAIGQAAAAIFAGGALGMGAGEINRSHAKLKDWLEADGERPEWPRLELLTNAREYPGRHEAILLPWKAAREALCKFETSG